MSKIRQSLERLHQSLGRLENNISTVENKIAEYQHDMFSQASNAPSNQNDLGESSGANAQILAQRLDTAIEKVERILQEA